METPRDFAKNYIKPLVLRGDSLESILDGSGGYSSIGFSVQIGGYLWSDAEMAKEKGTYTIKLKRDEIGVNEFKGVEVFKVFKVKELYDEIKRGDSTMPILEEGIELLVKIPKIQIVDFAQSPYHSIKIADIRRMAYTNGWYEVKSTDPTMVSFKQKDCRMNIWYTRMTVGTYLNHPKQGKTQLFRRNVEMKLLEKLFLNPRQHTNKGYKKRRR